MTEPAGIETTPDDAARAEADRRGAELYLGDSSSPTPAQIRAAGVYGYGFIHGAEWGRADERARIAARRDEVAEVDEPEAVTTAAELDALPVGSVVLSTAHDYMEAPALARQRRGWFGAWDWDAPIRAEEIVPAVVLHRGGDR